MNMLLALEKIPRLHNILVSFFTWILLIGFIVMTGSFMSGPLDPSEDSTLGSAANASTLVVGTVSMGMGLLGVGWLAFRWRKNYVWLLNKLYLPLVLNSLAGFIATFVSIYAQQGGEWHMQAIITISVEAFVLVTSSVLFCVYNFWFSVRVGAKSSSSSSSARYQDTSYFSTGDGVGGGGGSLSRKSLAHRVYSVRKAPSLAPGSVV